jgi:hypothetical protein
LHQTYTNKEEKAGWNMSEEWRKFELRIKITGGKYLKIFRRIVHEWEESMTINTLSFRMLRHLAW